jgi:hypothetical protein
MENELQMVEIECPYCGQIFTTTADCSAGPQEYVEDCWVCCQPILMQLRVDVSGQLAGLEARREND